MSPEQARFREILADVLRSRGASWMADRLMAGDQGVVLVEDALAAMQRAARIGEWQSMETAKQDGSFMFLFCPEDGSRWMASWQSGEWYGVDEVGLTRSMGYHKGSDRVTGWEITHWMPPPASPPPWKE